MESGKSTQIMNFRYTKPYRCVSNKVYAHCFLALLRIYLFWKAYKYTLACFPPINLFWENLSPPLPFYYLMFEMGVFPPKLCFWNVYLKRHHTLSKIKLTSFWKILAPIFCTSIHKLYFYNHSLTFLYNGFDDVVTIS